MTSEPEYLNLQKITLQHPLARESLQRAAQFYPRFLFRGFHGQSGGAIEGLNTKTEIVPHAFLTSPNLPTTPDGMTVEQAQASIMDHFNGAHAGSLFSSWAANFESAVHFALGGPTSRASGQDWLWFDESQPRFSPRHIAVIDTYSIPDHERVSRVFHAPAVNVDAPVEYLVYGPLRAADGVDLRVVDVEQVRRSVMCHKWPRCPSRLRMPHPVAKTDVREAAQVAKCFVKVPGDLSEAQDVPLAVLAAELGRQQWPTPAPSSRRSQEQEQVEYIDWTENDLITIRNNIPKYMSTALSGMPFAIDEIAWLGFPQLKLMQDVLDSLQREPLPRVPASGPDPRDLDVAVEAIRDLVLNNPTVDQRHLIALVRAADQEHTSAHDCNGVDRVTNSTRPVLSSQFDSMLHGTVPQLKDAVLDQPVLEPTFGLNFGPGGFRF